jgi:hypothetical protein
MATLHLYGLSIVTTTLTWLLLRWRVNWVMITVEAEQWYLVSNQYTRQRGAYLFSIVCAYPEFADSIRNIVAAKGLHLHEHEFRPEKWPRLEREKAVEHDYRPAEEKSVQNTDQGIAGSENSTETEKTIGYEYRATKETTIGYRYSAN